MSEQNVEYDAPQRGCAHLAWKARIGALAFTAALGLLVLWTMAPAAAAPFMYMVGAERLLPDDNQNNRLFVFDTATNDLVATVPIGGLSTHVDKMALHPAGTFVYVISYELTDFSGTIYVINTATNAVVATVRPRWTPQNRPYVDRAKPAKGAGAQGRVCCSAFLPGQQAA